MLCAVRYSYHTHTLLSDGKSAIEEHCEAACALGLEELGFSDHFTLRPDGSPCRWSMEQERLPEYVARVQAARDKYAGRLTVRLGIEADYFPETASHTKEILSQHPLDYVICSVHFVDGIGIDESREVWTQATEEQRNSLFRRYWELVQEMAESRLGIVAAHLDLPKKYGYTPSISLDTEIEAALEALAKHDWAVELNTAGWHKPCGEQYPSENILKEVRARHIPVILSSDAHEATHLTRDFLRGMNVLVALGWKEDEVAGYRLKGLDHPSPSEATE